MVVVKEYSPKKENLNKLIIYLKKQEDKKIKEKEKK
jgi:hypothetical protein